MTEEFESGASNLQYYSLTLFERARYINDALVAAAAETELLITQSLNETSVNKHIHLFKQRTLGRVPKNLLKKISGVTPYILAATLLYSTGKRSKALWLEHRVATRKGHIGKRVGKDCLKNILDIDIMAVVYIP